MIPKPIEVKVSYAGRTGVSIAIGSVIMLVGIVLLVMYFVQAVGTGASAAASSEPACTKDSTGPLTCAAKSEDSSTLYNWTVADAGTYTFTVAPASPTAPPRSLDITGVNPKTNSYEQMKFEIGDENKPTKVTLALKPGRYMVTVGDVAVTKHVGLPYKLSLEKQGGDKTAAKATPAADVPPFPVPILVIPALGLIFLFLPFLFNAEKARIPRFIDPGCVTMRHGQKLPWNEYQSLRVLKEVRSGTAHEVGVELKFARGVALLKYRPIKNWQEIGWIVDALKQNRNPWV